LIPDTRPHIIFNEDGVCQACINNDKKPYVDWEARFKELEDICDKYRRNDGNYDCIVAVSGGKDSHYITSIMKDKLNMNPLLVCVGSGKT